MASRELGGWTRDTAGLNAGLYAGLYGLASGAEVLGHFEQVMSERFLTSGELRRMNVRSKSVDATLARTEVPATHGPKYALGGGISLVPPNALPAIGRPGEAHAACCVVGAGKTGMDAILWLLEHGVTPARIRWIKPRADFQPGAENFERSVRSLSLQFDAIAQADSQADLFRRLEADGQLLRIDTRVTAEARTRRAGRRAGHALHRLNGARWRQHPELSRWLSQCRLNSQAAMLRGNDPNAPAVRELLRDKAMRAGATAARIPALLASTG